MVSPSQGAQVQMSIRWYVAYLSSCGAAGGDSLPHVPPSVAKKPVPVTSEIELSVMKNKVAELRAQVNQYSSRERSSSTSGEGFNIVSEGGKASVVGAVVLNMLQWAERNVLLWIRNICCPGMQL